MKYKQTFACLFSKSEYSKMVECNTGGLLFVKEATNLRMGSYFPLALQQLQLFYVCFSIPYMILINISIATSDLNCTEVCFH